MYLLDTNILIRAVQGKEPEGKFLDKIITNNSLVISVVVIAEFLAKANEKEEVALDKLLSQVKILEIDERVAREAAEYRKLLQKAKRVIIVDCFLAAQAKLNKLILVTNNKSDFPMEDIKIITPSSLSPVLA